jgi:hypothetical protein
MISNETKTKKCSGCGKTKAYSEFNNRNVGWGDKKYSFCRVCHKLRHKAIVIAAHRAGYTGGKKWTKALPFSERKPLLDEVFKELLEEEGENYIPVVVVKKIKQKPNKRTKRPFVKGNRKRLFGDQFSHDPGLAEIKKSRKSARKLLNNKQVEDQVGYIYVISHPYFTGQEGFVSIGKACTYDSRHSGYNRGDPKERYKLEFAKRFDNRAEAEDLIHSKLKSVREGQTEWFEMSVVDAIYVVNNTSLEEITCDRGVNG